MIDGFGRSVGVGTLRDPLYPYARTEETGNRSVFPKAGVTGFKLTITIQYLSFDSSLKAIRRLIFISGIFGAAQF